MVSQLGGHNLEGSAIVPVFIVSASGINDSTKKNFLDCCPTYPNLARINGMKIGKGIVANSKKGGVTQENITGIAVEMISMMFPDVADEDGKRVLWITDFHGSRFSLKFINTMKKMGVVVAGWLPNTTSLMQSCDTTLFGPFKTRNKKKKKVWRQENLGKAMDKYTMVNLAGASYVETFTIPRYTYINRFIFVFIYIF